MVLMLIALVTWPNQLPLNNSSFISSFSNFFSFPIFSSLKNKLIVNLHNQKTKNKLKIINKIYLLPLGEMPKRFLLDLIVESDGKGLLLVDFTLSVILAKVLLMGSIVPESESFN